MAPDDAALRALLAQPCRIAVVGLGANPEKPAYRVAQYLQRHGHTIVPVHPAVAEVLGVPAVPSLEAAAAGGPVDIVDVFRRSDAIPELVPALVAIRPRLVWLQLGITSPEAAAALEAAGIPLVMDRCLKIEHARLSG